MLTVFDFCIFASVNLISNLFTFSSLSFFINAFQPLFIIVNQLLDSAQKKLYLNFNIPIMKADLKGTIFFESCYFHLSKKLRDALGLKIDRLYRQDRFKHYINTKIAQIENSSKSDLLCAYFLINAPKDYILSGKLLKGIKIWLNMNYDDRLFVINKFKTCYQNSMLPENINQTPMVTNAFCKFLISELLVILAESRWQDLVDHNTNYRQLLYN